MGTHPFEDRIVSSWEDSNRTRLQKPNRAKPGQPSSPAGLTDMTGQFSNRPSTARVGFNLAGACLKCVAESTEVTGRRISCRRIPSIRRNCAERYSDRKAMKTLFDNKIHPRFSFLLSAYSSVETGVFTIMSKFKNTCYVVLDAQRVRVRNRQMVGSFGKAIRAPSLGP